MKNWPTDPLRQHNRFIAAFCDDLFDMCVNGGNGTPSSDRVAEISRQVNKSIKANRDYFGVGPNLRLKSRRDAGAANNGPATNNGD